MAYILNTYSVLGTLLVTYIVPTFQMGTLRPRKVGCRARGHSWSVRVGLEPSPATSKAPSPCAPPSATSFLNSQVHLSPQKQRLEALVWQPLCSLAKALAGPQNLIKKRLDKLLDFERVEEKLLEVGSMTYEEEAARHMYEALNSLLVAELPQFKQLAVRWLGQILCTFVTLQRDLAKQVLQRAEGSLAQVRPLGLGCPWGIARQGLVAPSASCLQGWSGPSNRCLGGGCGDLLDLSYACSPSINRVRS